MVRYKNINGDSNVEAYNIGDTFIEVKFKGTAKIYRYSYSKAGSANVERMKQLAVAGDGLNSFINHNVKYKYD